MKKRASLLTRNLPLTDAQGKGIKSTLPKNVSSSDPDVLRRCNSLPILISNNMHCKWNQKSTKGVQNSFVSSDFNSKCLYLLDTSVLNFESLNLKTEPKSLHKLQTEVDALKEFQNLVLETFPDLRTKILSLRSVVPSSASQSYKYSVNQFKKNRMRKKPSALSEMGPFIINPADSIGETLPLLVSRCRSYPNCCKKEAKSGEGSGIAVQDSGFSTESSKDCFSASASSGGLQGTNLSYRLLHDSDDELLNLLDVISRKTLKFRRKFPNIASFSCDKHKRYSPNNLSSMIWRPKILRFDKNYSLKKSLLKLSKERDKLLVKVAELESEMFKNRMKISKMETKFKILTHGHMGLEHQFNTANQNQEANLALLRCNFDSISNEFSHEYTKSPCSEAVISTNPKGTEAISTGIVSKHRSEYTIPLKPATSIPKVLELDASFKHLDIKDTKGVLHPTIELNLDSSTKGCKTDIKILGKLDGILSSPQLLCKFQDKNSKKIAEILLEANPLELQRHLLMLTVENQMKRFYSQQNFKKFVLLKLKNNSAQLPVHQMHNMSGCMNSYSTCSLKQQAHGEPLNFEKDEPLRKKGIIRPTRSFKNNVQYMKKLNSQHAKQPKPSKIPLFGTRTLCSLKAIKNESNEGNISTFTTKHKALSLSTGNINLINKISKISSISADSKFGSHRIVPIQSSFYKMNRNFEIDSIRQSDYVYMTNENIQMEKKNDSNKKLSVQNRYSNLVRPSTLISSLTRSSKCKKMDTLLDQNMISRQVTKSKLEIEKKISYSTQPGIQLLIGGTTRQTSTTNSSYKKCLAEQTPSMEDDIGKVQNMGSTLLDEKILFSTKF